MKSSHVIFAGLILVGDWAQPGRAKQNPRTRMPIKGADMGRCFMMLSFKRWFREPVAWRGGRAPVRSSLNTQLLVDAMAFIPLASEPRDFLTLQSQAGHQ